jgi:prolyl-tRNA synthetase
MKFSEYFIPTLREEPAEAEVISHKLMMRAGMIRKVAAGIYNYLPLGLKMIRKVEQIVRDEMNKAGAIELLMPSVCPSELWKESKRWDFYGKELLRLKDRHNREFCIGPTHEEVITDLVRKEIKSYKQLPVNFYQIQTKFRDEIRPRFGLMRGREFIMKDAYSFDIDNEHAEISYKKMFDAYTNIFQRCGLEFRTVDADTGSIGGSFSHEFMVLAKNGEDAIVSCNSCSYSANVEKSPVKKFAYNADLTNEKELTPEEVYTPNVKTIEEVSNYLNIPVNRILKTIILTDGENVVAALVRGDFDVNIVKIKNILDWDTIFFATEETVKAVTNAPSGFSGPINIKCPVIADYSAEGLKNFVIGANKKDYHIKNTNFKDIGEVTFHDIRNAESGDPCPQCEKGVLEIFRGIEVGHIFKLGTKYSEAMGAYFLDSNGKRKPCIMGCYGIGIGRTAAAAIEQNFDDKGMILPLPISPFTVHLLPVDYKNEEIGKVTDNIYNLLQNSGIDVLMDDRNERPGIKFNDADLLGFPYRITIGKKTLKQGKVEIYERKSGNVNLTDIDSISDFITMLENQAN